MKRRFVNIAVFGIVLAACFLLLTAWQGDTVYAAKALEAPAPDAVAAEEERIKDLAAIIEAHEKVKKAEIMICGETAVAAIRCDAIYFRSENQAVKRDIAKILKDEGFTEVFVTKDQDIFLKLSDLRQNPAGKSRGGGYAEAKKDILKTVKERERG